MKAISLSLILFPALASASAIDLPKGPNLTGVNTTIIGYEHSRWEAQAKWQEAESTLPSAELELAHRQKQWKRGKALVENSTISKEAFAILTYELRCSEIEIKRLRAESARMKNLAQAYRAMAELEESSSSALMREALDAQIAAERAHAEVMTALMEKSQVEAELTQRKKAGGEKLLQSDSLSESEFDRRELNAQLSAGRLAGWKQQLKISAAKIKSLEELRSRVR